MMLHLEFDAVRTNAFYRRLRTVYLDKIKYQERGISTQRLRIKDTLECVRNYGPEKMCSNLRKNLLNMKKDLPVF